MPCPNCPTGTGESASLGDNGIERRCLGCRSLVTEAPAAASEPVNFPAWAELPTAMAKAVATKPVPPTDILGAAKARLAQLDEVLRAAAEAGPEAQRLRQVIAILEPAPASASHPLLRAVGDS